MSHQNSNEQRIRDLITRWVSAVHAGDMEAVLADHAPDIVMFDVPPPHSGIRGLDLYQAAWPDFFKWQSSGATFELTELEAIAGEEVAYAWALLRCGSADDHRTHPGRRLRLTIGLRLQGGRWTVAHEHHSFAFEAVPATMTDRDAEVSAVSEIRELHSEWSRQTARGDLDGMMSMIDDDVVSYEHGTQLACVGKEEARDVCAAGLETGDDAEIAWEIPDMEILAHGSLAVSWGLDHITGQGHAGKNFESWSRGTRVFRRTGDSWKLIHQHVSFPIDLDSGQALTDLDPGATSRPGDAR